MGRKHEGCYVLPKGNHRQRGSTFAWHCISVMLMNIHSLARYVRVSNVLSWMTRRYLISISLTLPSQTQIPSNVREIKKSPPHRTPARAGERSPTKI